MRRLRKDEGALLREVRLRSLEDAPYAFSSWHAREVEYAPEVWERRAAQSEAGETGVVFVAQDRGRCLGMAGGYLADGDPQTPRLWGMWVEPGGRRRGLGRQLTEAVAGWARDRGAERLELCVADGEASRPAAALYRALGFVETGGHERLGWDASQIALVMSRPL